MNGKILKISNNDLYGNVDDRKVVVFAAFNHLKYMNKYVIFTYLDEYYKNKLYYGSLHLKDNSLVTFMISDTYKPFIDKFINDYLNKTVNPEEYQIIDISKMEKIELVSFNTMDFAHLSELDSLSIYHEPIIKEDEIEKKPIILYILLFILFLMLIGISLLYFFPEKFTKKLPLLECSINNYNNNLELNYLTTRTIKFNEDEEISSIEVIDNYQFTNRYLYNDFKDNKKELTLMNNKSAYEYNDDLLTLKIIYQEESIITNYDEIFKYLKNNGYTCKEDVYYE